MAADLNLGVPSYPTGHVTSEARRASKEHCGLLADVRPRERRGAFLAFATVTAILMAHELLETARDAVFLARVGPKELPWVYLAIAMLGMALYFWRVRRPAGTNTLASTLTVWSVVTASLTLVLRWPAPWTSYLLYIVSGLLAMSVMTQFWLVVGGQYTTSEAKRIFGSLVVQIFFVGRLLEWFGVTRSAALLPLMIFGGSIGIAVGGGLMLALLTKGLDGSFRHSAHRTALEVLYVPMPAKLRRAAKMFIEVAALRGAQAMTSLALLGATVWLSPSVDHLAAAIANSSASNGLPESSA